MIISHKLKVIYIKLTKVAGSSFEIALSKYCDANDIITPLARKDECTRVSLGFISARNYIDVDARKPKFYNHIAAGKIKSLVPADLWNHYLKIATIRCPYDMYISAYYFFVKEKARDSGATFEQFVTRNNKVISRLVSHLHNNEGKILVDFIIRYEYFDQDIKALEERINCPELLKTFKGITVKGNKRPKTGTSSCEMYSKYPNAKFIVDEKCQKFADRYEFFAKHLPMYKTRLEEAIKDYAFTVAGD